MKNYVLKKNTDIYGYRNGIGLLGENIPGRGVDLSNSPPRDKLE